MVEHVGTVTLESSSLEYPTLELPRVLRWNIDGCYAGTSTGVRWDIDAGTSTGVTLEHRRCCAGTSTVVTLEHRRMFKYDFFTRIC